MKNFFLFCVFVLFITSCNSQRNKLNSNEQKLAAQIKAEELKKQEAETALEQNSTAFPDTFPVGIRFQPEREIDANNPPELIDIAGNLDKVKELKLSDIAESIHYIRLESPGDSAFFGELNNHRHRRNAASLKEELPFTIIKNKEFIIAQNYLGMLLYNSKGKLLRIVSKNELNGFTLYKSGVSGGSGSTFKGAHSYPRLVGNKLYYSYEDDVNKIARMMELDCSNLPLALPAQPENNNAISGLGKPVANTGERSYSAVALGPDIYSKTGLAKKHEDMLTIYNRNGDTLCSFLANQKIVNYTKSVGRTADWGNRTFYRNNFYFREAHSDTIFKVLPPNKLIPAFIINLGEYKIHNFQDGMDPAFNLSNKFMPKTISITDNFVFIFYTQGYGSSNARKRKTVKYFHAIYNRKTKELWHVRADPYNYEFALENDIDGGLPVWPGGFSRKYFVPSSISEGGNILQSVKGEVLKEYIVSAEFKNSTAPENRKQELVELANKVGKYETVVVEMK